MRRIKVLTGYAAHARFTAECGEDWLGFVPTDWAIPSPYAYSPSRVVWSWRGQSVVIYETRHRRYEVFAIGAQPLLTDDDASTRALAIKGNSSI